MYKLGLSTIGATCCAQMLWSLNVRLNCIVGISYLLYIFAIYSKLHSVHNTVYLARKVTFECLYTNLNLPDNLPELHKIVVNMKSHKTGVVHCV